MVRRMLANAGHPVEALVRLRFAGLTLGSLEVGEARAATDAEVEGLRSLVGQ
jgi:16S rRNA U516 pseudouridylate synthase RsuA-like enzyme